MDATYEPHDMWPIVCRLAAELVWDYYEGDRELGEPSSYRHEGGRVTWGDGWVTVECVDGDGWAQDFTWTTPPSVIRAAMVAAGGDPCLLGHVRDSLRAQCDAHGVAIDTRQCDAIARNMTTWLAAR